MTLEQFARSRKRTGAMTTKKTSLETLRAFFAEGIEKNHTRYARKRSY